MAHAALRSDERIGLIIALALHAALVAALVWGPRPPAPLPVPERMTVTLSEDVGLTSTSPEPAARPAPDVAPMLGERPAPVPLPELEPIAKPAPKVAPMPPPRPAPRVASPRPKVAAKASAQPQRLVTPPRRPTQQAGGSRIGTDFLKGVSGARTNGTATNPPAAAIGPAERSALGGAISRQLKPRWVAPQGADAEKLITVLAWSLNRDGSLAGSPRVVRQDGITDANRAQAARHAEQAVRAVQLAAPFDLPPEYYGAWQRIADFRFDRRLSQ